MKLLITGDLVLNQPYQTSYIDQNLVDLFKKSDLNIVNLEAPVTTSNTKINKTGPNIKYKKKSNKKDLKDLEVNVFTLANNHVLDYDEQGVIDTLEFCRENEIQTVGAGKNLKDASKIFYFDSAEGKIAIVNFAENEWTSAKDNRAGSNPMNFIDNYTQIQEAKNKADFVIVIVHGGNEYNPYPSPRMVKQYRFYAENGADAVISHHTHCTSGNEIHKSVPILYSLGNFLFTKESRKEVWYSGLIASLIIKKDHPITFEVIPVQQSRESFQLKLHPKKQLIHKNIEEINTVIADETKLEERWIEFVQKYEGGYISTITPMAGINNRYLRAILYRSGIYKWFLNDRYLKESLNRIRCESHQEVTKSVLLNLIKQKNE